MSPLARRLVSLIAMSLVAVPLAGACGGKTATDVPLYGDGGTGSTSGGSSGGSTSTSSTGSSSGTSSGTSSGSTSSGGTSSGGTSGGSSGWGSSGSSAGGSSGGSSGWGSSSTGGSASGSSSGGSYCTPLPGCMSTQYCPAGDGCNYCTCQGGAWGCTDIACPNACPPSPPVIGSMCGPNGLNCSPSTWGYCAPDCTCENGFWNCAFPPCPPPVCPPTPPQGGTSCYQNGLSCGPQNYPGTYCAPSCTCDNGIWNCSYPPCPPPPSCPLAQPSEYSQCFEVGQTCGYYYGCSSAYCTCQSPGTWFCSIGDCTDGGPIDAGVDAGEGPDF